MKTVAYIIAICVPYQITICIYCIGLISLDVFDICQGRSIGNGVVSLYIFQAVTDDDLLGVSHGICHYINDLILMKGISLYGRTVDHLIHDPC